jgi:TolA-binding protein
MAEGIESIGEAMTGGMVARAVEPQAGEAGGHSEACLNCGTRLTGPFCHQCGQRGHVHRTIGAFAHDIAHSVLHFDGKMWRTLPLLAWHPGELTRRYVEGERANFVSPMALFLFSVFMMFAVVSALGAPIALDGGDGRTNAEERAEAKREFEKETAEARQEMQRLRVERERLAGAGQPTQDIDRQIQIAQAAFALEERLMKEALGRAEAEDQRDAEQAAREAAAEALGGAADPAAKAPAAKKDGGSVVDDNKGTIGLTTNWPRLDAAIKKANENPSLLFYKIQTNAYKFSWALIPISVPFVWLMFLHRRRYRQYRAYDHVVFVTYSIAFMSLGFIVLTLLRPLGFGEWLFGLAITFVPPIHMYRQLRGAYSLSRWSAVWRTFMLLMFSSIAASLFLLLLVALGALA